MSERPSEPRPIPKPPSWRLPRELQLLFVGAEEPSWTLLTLELDRYGCTQPRFRWCSTLAEGAQHMGRERFDCIVIDDAGTPAAAARPLELADQLSAIRAAGCEDPILVLSDRVDDPWLIAAAAGEFELLVVRNGWRSSALAPWIHTAMHRQTVARERAEIGAEGRQRLQREAGESWQLLDQRRQTAERLRRSLGSLRGPAAEGAAALADEYRDLLRAAVVAGAHALEAETLRFTRGIVERGITAADLLQMHVAAVESLLRGLGSRSSRHVVQQTDLLVLEVLCRLADGTWTAGGRGVVDDRGIDLLDESVGPSGRPREQE